MIALEKEIKDRLKKRASAVDGIVSKALDEKRSPSLHRYEGMRRESHSLSAALSKWIC